MHEKNTFVFGKMDSDETNAIIEDKSIRQPKNQLLNNAPRNGNNWNVESLGDDNDEIQINVNLSEQQQQQSTGDQQPKRIGERRRSARLMSMSERENNNISDEDEAPDGPPPEKKRKGRPPKKKNRQTKSRAAPPSGGGGSGSTSTADQNENSSVPNVGTSHDEINVDTGINPRCELSGAILKLYAGFRQDSNPKYKNRYSAKCTLCENDDDNRKNYLKGNITNLKLHLQRVSIKFSCVRACSFVVVVVSLLISNLLLKSDSSGGLQAHL